MSWLRKKKHKHCLFLFGMGLGTGAGEYNAANGRRGGGGAKEVISAFFGLLGPEIRPETRFFLFLFRKK